MQDKQFVSPSHDRETTGRGMSPGPTRPVGYRTPVGKFEARGVGSGPIPQESKCFDLNNVLK